MTKTAIPYGFWPSDWTAADAASASCDFAELRAGHDGLFWIQYDPADARSTLWYWRADVSRCLTPSGFSLRSRIYEYGGGAFCLTDEGIAFVNEHDQQIYLQDLSTDAATPPIALTVNDACRYGDLQFDTRHRAVLAVEETAEEARSEHRLVSVSLMDGSRSVLAEGSDFYSSPTLDTTGQRLAWIEWQRPEQPWTATRLWTAERTESDCWGAPRCLAGAAGNESLQQPRFAADGALYCLSDREGWWQPWRMQGDSLVPVTDTAGFAQARCDHAPAPWQLGTVSYLPLADGALLMTRMVDGYGLLFEQDSQGNERQLAMAFSRCRQLAVDERHFYCIAGSADKTSAVLALDRVTGVVEILAGGQQPLAADQLSRPQPFSFSTGHGEVAHAFFYPPSNTQCQSLPLEKPPLVVFMHGGPTSASYPVFDPRIQYWTQRGFAVADINYRGSSGFGRAYRQRLRGEWGVVDVEDACAAVQALATNGQIDPARAFIRGSSAGGYSALCALAANAGFSGGASLYGVSDPLALRRVTHKFEADYLDWLIGDPAVDAERYRQRTPLLNAGLIRVPVIFFQGGQDAVVLPEQTESMVAALRERGVTVEYCLYPQERHGFRQAANLADALERECRFYQRLLR
ncbi:S9 family peptidase [Pseudomonas stutzeri]|uniref:alpha/beta hydrolase family protein n=1 Tax=Stutzerimonas stutzeri TaxID=316 RepID=UPI002109368B|nr:S9 family peptidase [Stutzerimonas stutzeri]MCQ4310405.1 S9 family peptidase [Stutzerimonas stutzeri]